MATTKQATNRTKTQTRPLVRRSNILHRGGAYTWWGYQHTSDWFFSEWTLKLLCSECQYLMDWSRGNFYRPLTWYDGRLCFHRCLSVQVGGGVPQPGPDGRTLARSRWQGVPSQVQICSTRPGSDGGYPSQVQTGGYPNQVQMGGTLARDGESPGQGWGTPRPGIGYSPSPPDSTADGVLGMPLSFTQDDFLDHIRSVTFERNVGPYFSVFQPFSGILLSSVRSTNWVIMVKTIQFEENSGI